jgi:predicted dehydrogenase
MAPRRERSADEPTPVGIAIVGAGYWGPNLLRNLCAHDGADVRWLCDLDVERARSVVGRYSTVGVTSELAQVLADPTVEAVVVATPAATHAAIGLAAIESGRHVLVEKPLATTRADGERLVAAADEHGRVLMCDHTYCYTPAVQEIRRLVHSGVLGEIQYVDAVRINLGLIRPDTDVVWDLAPHDLSILDHVLPASQRPRQVAAYGVDPVGAGRACIGYVSLPLGGDALAHLHVNWLSPTKVRTMIVGGSERMVVWDDLQPSQRLSLYDTGVDLSGSPEDRRRELRVAYRSGTIVSPALPEVEALQGVVTEFVSSIRERRAPATDGHAGLRVLEQLEAARASLLGGGVMVDLERTPSRSAA